MSYAFRNEVKVTVEPFTLMGFGLLYSRLKRIYFVSHDAKKNTTCKIIAEFTKSITVKLNFNNCANRIFLESWITKLFLSPFE